MDLQGFGVSIYLIQVIFGAVDLPAKLVGFLVINSLGRRPAQMASLLLAGVCILINGVIPQGEHPRVPWSFVSSPSPRFSAPAPELPPTPAFLSRSVHCPNFPCCSGERLPGYLLQLHLPIYWGAVPHGDPVSGSQVGGVLGQDFLPTHRSDPGAPSSMPYSELVKARHVSATCPLSPHSIQGKDLKRSKAGRRATKTYLTGNELKLHFDLQSTS